MKIHTPTNPTRHNFHKRPPRRNPSDQKPPKPSSNTKFKAQPKIGHHYRPARPRFRDASFCERPYSDHPRPPPFNTIPWRPLFARCRYITTYGVSFAYVSSQTWCDIDRTRFEYGVTLRRVFCARLTFPMEIFIVLKFPFIFEGLGVHVVIV